jgi:hypothetical protein
VLSARAIVRNLTPDLLSAHIAACAERQTARNIASRTARCDQLHWPRRDFSSRPIDFPRDTRPDRPARRA